MELAGRDGEGRIGGRIGDEIDAERAEDEHVATIVGEGEVGLIFADGGELGEDAGREVVAPDVLGSVEAEGVSGDLRQELSGGKHDGFAVGGEARDAERSGLPIVFGVERDFRAVRQVADDQVRIARAAYYGLVSFMDEQIGKLLSTLAGTRFGDNTLIVYTSDHGEMAGEHRMWWKSSFYQDSVGVPLIFSLPGQLAEGRTISEVTSLLDIGPTLVDLAGGEPMSCVRGRGLKDFLVDDGSVPTWTNTAFAELGGVHGDAPARMIRRGEWKLNYYHGHDRPQLFNLEADPGEWNDLADHAAYSGVRDELLAEVTTDWSGETVLRTLETTQYDSQVLEEFRTNSHASAEVVPERWTAPEGCNVFPEM